MKNLSYMALAMLAVGSTAYRNGINQDYGLQARTFIDLTKPGGEKDLYAALDAAFYGTGSSSAGLNQDDGLQTRAVIDMTKPGGEQDLYAALDAAFVGARDERSSSKRRMRRRRSLYDDALQARRPRRRSLRHLQRR